MVGCLLGSKGEARNCGATREHRVAAPRSRPLIVGSGSDRYPARSHEAGFELRRGQVSRDGIPLGRVEILALIKNLVASLRFGRRIVRTGVGIDLTPIYVQVDSPDVQRLVNVTNIVHECAERFPL